MGRGCWLYESMDCLFQGAGGCVWLCHGAIARDEWELGQIVWGGGASGHAPQPPHQLQEEDREV